MLRVILRDVLQYSIRVILCLSSQNGLKIRSTSERGGLFQTQQSTFCTILGLSSDRGQRSVFAPRRQLLCANFLQETVCVTTAN